MTLATAAALLVLYVQCRLYNSSLHATFNMLLWSNAGEERGWGTDSWEVSTEMICEHSYSIATYTAATLGFYSVGHCHMYTINVWL